MVDGSIVRVHQEGASKIKDRVDDAEGPSRGGLTTKIHSATDALGCPLRFIITEGQSSEHKQAEALISGLKAGYVLADKG